QKLWKSKVSSSAQREQETKKSSPSSSSTPPKPPQPQSATSSLLRWSRKYDVVVCHSSVHSDIQEAVRLVSFLEASPRSLRCFMMQRDACPGGAISTELCQAVQDSHLRALLITPDFLQDDWCTYMMHQVLAEGPMSNRIIPLVQNLSHSQYPQELRFYFYIDLDRNPDRGYNLVNTTVLKCE
uniref:TIR domain containing adaptor protein n=1 Tax=Cyclopterus lumpus TaxID=8103 RepID=A0A8C2ZH72_CYCLU